jgi:hypothetical protein
LTAVLFGAFLWILYTWIIRAEQKGPPAAALPRSDTNITRPSFDQRWNEWRERIAREHPPDERKMRDFLASSLERLLLKSSPQEREDQMREIERLLEESLGPVAGSFRRESPALFAADLFQENPGTSPLVANALTQHSKDWDPVESSAGPADLVASLLPSDHDLE